ILTLNDENDNLHIQITEMRDTAATVLLAKPQSDRFIDTQATVNESTDEPQDLDSILQESTEVQRAIAIDPNNSDLRVETLVANLEHSQKTISKL
ncbi:hypothetical protein KEM56_006201, partial [Ascosphaera pollenicola]